MLYVKVNGKEKKVIFRHERDGKGKHSKPVSTVCGIFENDTPVGEGVATVYVTDRVEYEKGRKISLKYAMEAAGLTREERKQIWEGYNAR